MIFLFVIVIFVGSASSCAPSGNAGIERTTVIPTTTTKEKVCQPDQVTLGTGDGTATVDVTYEAYVDALSTAGMTVTCTSGSATKTVTMTFDGKEPTAAPNGLPVVAIPLVCSHSENQWKYGTSTDVSSVECALN